MPAFEIPCVIYRQREEPGAPRFAIFATTAHSVLQWAAIRRREDDPAGPQRRLSQAKINAIRRFFQLDARNTIPTAVIVTLTVPEAAIELAVPGNPGLSSLHFLRFNVADGTPPHDLPGVVIDGQHRLFGMDGFNQGCFVNVVALLNVDDTEKAFQFLVINNKATRVPSDLIRTLALDYQGQALSERLQTARLTLDENLKYVGIVDRDESSPFRGHVGLVSHEGDQAQRFVPPAAIENSIALIQKKGEGVRELQNDDALCEFLYAIWGPIHELWPELWTADSRLMLKVSIVAMTSYMAELLVARYDYGDLDLANPEDVRQKARRLLEMQAKEFWQCEWTIRINDSKVIQDKLVETLTLIARNIRADQSWHEGIDMVRI